MDMDFEFDNEPMSVYQPKDKTTETDDNSDATKNIENINKELYCTRVDLRIRVPPHTNPEEKQFKYFKTFY